MSLNLFKKMNFAMLIPEQDMAAIAALGKDLIKLGAKGVACGKETLVDRDNKPVYNCLVVAVEKMPKRAALKFLAKHGMELIEKQGYMLNDEFYKLFM